MFSKWWQLRWLFNRRTGAMFVWTLLLLATAIIVNLLGIRVAGSVENWQRWMSEHAAVFLIWRLMLYAFTMYGWIWMRRRLLAREPGASTQQRLRRAELSAVLAVILLETSQFLPLA